MNDPAIDELNLAIKYAQHVGYLDAVRLYARILFRYANSIKRLG